MECTLNLAGDSYRLDLGQPFHLGIPLSFSGPQPSHFGAPRALARPFLSGSFKGNTREGGSCNVSVLELIPHCQGTHTECVGHVSHESEGIHELLGDILIPAFLVSVEAALGRDSGEGYDPVLEPDDLVITREELVKKCNFSPAPEGFALVLRWKRDFSESPVRSWGGNGAVPPYFTNDAMAWLSETRIRHLLVEFPSLDRTNDAGRLSNHRIYWQMPPGERSRSSAKAAYRTITEMISVPENLKDGLYCLNLQIPPFESDAAPSRPVIFAMELL